MFKLDERRASTAVTKESKQNARHRTLARAVQHIIERNEETAQRLRGPNAFTKPTESQSTSTGRSTSTSRTAASYVEELQALENALASITAIPQARYADFSAQLATGMSWGTYVTSPRRWNVQRSISETRQRYRC